MNPEIEVLDLPSCELGENPLWDPNNRTLYWVDIVKGEIWSTDLSGKTVNSWKLPGSFLGSFALLSDGKAIVAMDDGFYRYDFDLNECEPLALPEKDESRTCFNDGKVDRNGQFIAGSREINFDGALGSVYRVGSGGTCTRLDTGFVCFNGPCWNPDGSVFYASDSSMQTIYAYDYNPNGPLENRRQFATTEELSGYPDGATIDEEGCLWSAIFGAGKIARYKPDGSLDTVIDLPVQYVSSVMFGGDKLDTLYVTSISCEIGGERDTSELAGRHFAIRGLDVQGIEEKRCTV